MRIFISYRRKTWPFTHRLARGLRWRLWSRVFVDVAGIDEPDFERSILRHLRQSDVFLLVVSEETFAPDRIHLEGDWVRREIAEALRLELPIVLALVDGLSPPPAEKLPADIRAITRMQGIEFYPRFFGPGLKELAKFVRRVARTRKSPIRSWIRILEVVSTLAAIGGLVRLLPGLIGGARVPESEPTPTSETTVDPAVALAEEGVTSNGEWAPYAPHIREFGGAQMALVPAGCFMMGSERGDSDEQPVHEQCFEKPFWMDLTEVTNLQYGSEGIFSGGDRPRDSLDWFEAAAHCES